jgi:hypothetical protein
MPVVKCRRCGAVATAQLGPEAIETSYGQSFRENCRELGDRAAADFVSTISECPAMDVALQRLATRLARQRRKRTAAAPATMLAAAPDEDPGLDSAAIDPTALARAQ